MCNSIAHVRGGSGGERPHQSVASPWCDGVVFFVSDSVNDTRGREGEKGAARVRPIYQEPPSASRLFFRRF